MFKKVNKLELTITYNKEIVYYKQGIASEDDQFEFLILQTKNYKPHKIYNSMIDFLIEHEYCELIEKSNKTVVVGNSLIDAVTGFELYKGPDAQKYSELLKH